MADAVPRQGALAHLGQVRIDTGDAPLTLRVEPRVDRALLLLRLRPDDAAAMDAIERALGTALPRTPNATAQTGSARIYWLGPDEWVIDADAADAAARFAAVGIAAAGQFALAIDIGPGRTCLAVSGSAAVDLLRKGCPLDLHPQAFPTHACARTLLGRVGVLLGAIEAGREYHLFVDRSYADYLWRWLVDAAREHTGGTPAPVHPTGDPA